MPDREGGREFQMTSPMISPPGSSCPSKEHEIFMYPWLSGKREKEMKQLKDEA